MSEYIKILMIVCPMVFVSGFVDSIAGGGGLISIPAYLFAGLPVHIAAGTNKFSACIGTAVSCKNYLKAGKVNFTVAIYAVFGALIGSAIGSKLALYISAGNLKMIIMVVLPVVAIFLATQKSYQNDEIQLKEMSHRKFIMISFGIGLLIGGYDGMLGPGAGTFMILCFTGILGVDLVTSSGCAKLCNLASNLGALTVFALGGVVDVKIGIPAAFCALLGNYAGSKLAIKGGAKYIRSIIFLVIFMLFVKFGYDLLVN